MQPNICLWSLLLLNAFSFALPTLDSKQRRGCHDLANHWWLLDMVERDETVDADDTFVYTWSIPEDKVKS